MAPLRSPGVAGRGRTRGCARTPPELLTRPVTPGRPLRLSWDEFPLSLLRLPSQAGDEEEQSNSWSPDSQFLSCRHPGGASLGTPGTLCSPFQEPPPHTVAAMPSPPCRHSRAHKNICGQRQRCSLGPGSSGGQGRGGGEIQVHPSLG